MAAEANAAPEPSRHGDAALHGSADIAKLIAALRYPRFGKFIRWWLGDGGLFPESRPRGGGPGSAKAAADKLVRIGPPAIGPLVAALPGRAAAADVLVRIGAPAVGALIAALGDQDREVRRLAARALGEIGDPAAAGPLTTALGDQDDGVRAAAAAALAGIEDAADGADYLESWHYRAVSDAQAADYEVWVWVFIAGVVGLFGWYLGHWYHWSSPVGLTVGLCVVGIAYGLTDSTYRCTVAGSALTFLVGVPLLYVLVLFAQLPLMGLGLASFRPQLYLADPVRGALAGCTFAVLWNAKGVSELVAKHHLDVREEFWRGASFRAPLAFLIAGGFVLPGLAVHKPAAMLALGIMCGVIAAGAVSAFVVLVAGKTLRQGWSDLLWVAGALLFATIGVLFAGIYNRPLLPAGLILLPAMAFTCALSYAAICLVARFPGRPRLGRRPG